MSKLKKYVFKPEHLDSEIHMNGSKIKITKYNIATEEVQKHINKFIAAHPQVFTHLQVEELTESGDAPADEEISYTSDGDNVVTDDSISEEDVKSDESSDEETADESVEVEEVVKSESKSQGKSKPKSNKMTKSGKK